MGGALRVPTSRPKRPSRDKSTSEVSYYRLQLAGDILRRTVEPLTPPSTSDPMAWPSLPGSDRQATAPMDTRKFWAAVFGQKDGDNPSLQPARLQFKMPTHSPSSSDGSSEMLTVKRNIADEVDRRILYFGSVSSINDISSEEDYPAHSVEDLKMKTSSSLAQERKLDPSATITAPAITLTDDEDAITWKYQIVQEGQHPSLQALTRASEPLAGEYEKLMLRRYPSIHPDLIKAHCSSFEEHDQGLGSISCRQTSLPSPHVLDAMLLKEALQSQSYTWSL